MRLLPSGELQFPGNVTVKVGGSQFDSVESLPGTGLLAGRRVMVFVHGYNQSHEGALEQAAQIAQGTAFDGIPLAFTWPCQGGGGLDSLRYLSELDRCDESAEALAETLELLKDAREIHLVAYSMGGRLAVQALGQLIGKDPSSDTLGNLASFTLFAPDVPGAPMRKLYVRRVAALDNRRVRVSIFYNPQDSALKFSSDWIRKDEQDERMGLKENNLVVVPQFDGSKLKGGGMGHSYVTDPLALRALERIFVERLDNWPDLVRAVLKG